MSFGEIFASFGVFCNISNIYVNVKFFEIRAQFPKLLCRVSWTVFVPFSDATILLINLLLF